jgi:butyryl-CoA dehydrogenase
MVVGGFLRKCIPQPAGGENAGLIDMAIMAEEFDSVNASVTLTMLGTVLGLLPILTAGTPEQCSRLLAPFLRGSGTPLAGFCSSEPGGSANAASPPPGDGVRTIAKLHGDRWVINGRKKWVSSATGGIVKVPISYAWCAGPRPTLHPRERFPSSWSNALRPASSSSAQSSP